MYMKSNTILQSLALIVLSGLMSSAIALDYEFYASLRVQAEAVEPDKEDTLDSYTGWRDAYSRIGLKASQPLNQDITAYGQVELPFDAANMRLREPWDQDESVRVAKVGLKGAYGDLAVGHMWLPYYNAIAYPLDMFSSYYSGFATYTSFRKDSTVAYYTPSFAGFSAAVAYSDENGAARSNGNDDDRWQATASYKVGDLTLAAGLDDLGGTNDSKIWGTSVMWQATDALLITAKYEEHDSDIDTGYGADGDAAMNLYAAYTVGKNTFRGTIADVDSFGENIVQLGLDHQYSDDLKFFVEYYSEQETAAITTRRGGADDTCWDCDGGQVIAVGLRYDFRAP